jgi:hypothetical protein
MVPPYSALLGVDSTAERRVAKLISELAIDHAAALYSFHLTQHARHSMGEVDFLVLFEDAFVAIEVKGGRVGRTDGLWTFTNRAGNTNAKREGPFDQARRGMFAVRDVLDDRLPAAKVGFASMVITPDQRLDPDPEWESWEHVGPGGMTLSGIKSALERARRHAVSNAHSSGVKQYSAMLRALRPDFEVLLRLSDISSRLSTEYVALRSEQSAVLEALDANERILCEGGAGTGKTLLAAEAARIADADGQSVLFTCRSSRIVDYVGELLTGTGARCVTFDRLGEQPPADVLVVDEGQDLFNLDDLQVLADAVIGGLEHGRWRIFTDTNNQAHVLGRYEPDVFDEIERWGTVWRLRDNVRNTAPIIVQTQLVTGADLGTARVGSGPAVGAAHADGGAAVQALDAELERLRGEDQPMETVAVVSLCTTLDESLAARSSAFARGGLQIAGRQTRPGIAQLFTAAEVKGIEFDHVCVTDIDTVEDPIAVARLYVAMSRARVSLWLCYGDRAWREIRNGRKAPKA